ncbi:MAG: hypothetical protein CSA22_00935 [Deltaproteobacteria bacterium]|nr:MAG: hypothetical protein CSA22_00935 [Deltaproteobacteria bacterium]
MFFIGRMVVAIVDLWLASVSMTVHHADAVCHHLKSGRYVGASWHGRLVLFFLVTRGQKPAVMTSRSKDGALAAQLQVCGGYTVFRGSSRKGGREALVKMINYMRTFNRPTLLSVDGPTGPVYKAKSGAVVIASKTGFPILPISFSGNRLIRFRSWDQAVFPKPFSKGHVIYGQPISVPPDCTTADIERYRLAVEAELNRITREVEPTFNPSD